MTNLIVGFGTTGKSIQRYLEKNNEFFSVYDDYQELPINLLIRVQDAIAKTKGLNAEQDAGIQIVLRAIEEPLRQIVTNAGEEASVIINKVKAEKGNNGYNAATDTYGDMVSMGVLDPTKVTRSALQNAASVAGLMLTTDCMIAELPKEDAPAAPDMGGMEKHRPFA